MSETAKYAGEGWVRVEQDEVALEQFKHRFVTESGDVIRGGIIVADRTMNPREPYRVYRSGPYRVHHKSWTNTDYERVHEGCVKRVETGKQTQ